MTTQNSTVPDGFNPSKTVIVYKEHIFTKATYNGFEILVHTQTGYINATRLCHDVSLKEGKRIKEFKNLKQSPQFIDYIEYLRENASAEIQLTPELKKFLINPSDFDMLENITGKGYNNDIKGTYIHPKLINCVLTMTSIKYLKIVSELMDSINSRVHEQLKQQQLEDTPSNAQPIFNKQVQQFTQMSLEKQNQQCWGVRDSPYLLDSNERDDLKRDIEFYNKAKSSLLKAREAVESWSTFVNEYIPRL